MRFGIATHHRINGTTSSSVGKPWERQMLIEQITRRELLGAMAATAVAIPIKPALSAAKGGAVRKVWIEVALNGPWSRGRQPGIPDTVEAIIAEGIACAGPGAAIIHTHAYDGG